MTNGTSMEDQQMRKVGPSFRRNRLIYALFDFFRIIAPDSAKAVEQSFYMGIDGKSGDIKSVPQKNIRALSADARELSEFFHGPGDFAVENFDDHPGSALQIL